MKSLLCAVALIIICAVTLVSAQDDNSSGVLILKDNTETNTKPAKPDIEMPADQTPAVPETYAAFYERWRAFEQAYDSGNIKEQTAILNQIIELKESDSVSQISDLAVSAVQYGNTEITRNPEHALTLYQAASRLDPSLAYAYYGISQAQLSRGVAGIIPAIAAAIRGMLAPQSSFAGAIYFRSTMILLILGALVVLGFCFALVMLLKYNLPFRHDAIEKYGSHHDASIIHVASFALFCLPLLIFFGFFWLAPFWILLFWGYGRKMEQVFGIFFLVVYLVAYPVYHRVVQYCAAVADPVVSTYVSALSQGPSPKAIRDLTKYMDEHPQDNDAPLELAYLYQRDHNLDQSVEILQKQMIDRPDDARAYNNLGILFSLQGQTDSALGLFQKAVQLDSSKAMYHYNLSKMHRAKFNFQDAEKVLQEARAINSGLVKSYEEGPPEKLIPAVPGQELVEARIQQTVGPVLPLVLNPFTIFGLLLLILTPVLYTMRVKKQGYASSCLKCGKAFCKKCQPTGKGYGFCTQCLHIFVKKDGVSPASRKEKMEEIERHTHREAWFCRILSLVLPGFADLYENNTVQGIIILLLWISALGLILFHRKLGAITYFEPADHMKALTIGCLLVMAVLFVVANLPALRRAKS